jgi:putative peptide zinc metalloprotease protein
VDRGVWARVSGQGEAGGIWRRVIESPVQALDQSDLHLWTALGERPGGLWEQVGGETLVIAEQRGDIWVELNDETLIIRPEHDLWRALQTARLPPRQTLGLWAQLDDETLVLTPTESSLWHTAAQSGDLTERKPTRRLGWALKPLSTSSGKSYYILKNTRLGTYLRLSEEQVFLWDLMDGEHTIEDIAIAYFARYQSLAVDELLAFLDQLQEKGFLVGEHKDLYEHTAHSLGQGWLKRTGENLFQALRQTAFSLEGIDLVVAGLYRAGGFLAFTLPAQILIFLIAVVGLVAFGILLFDGGYSVLSAGIGGLPMGLLGLYVGQFFAILLHESAHALTCKHFGREIRRAGFLFYWGMPAFFVDTTDIWMEPRRPRLLVSWAGPYSSFFLAGLASLTALLIPIQPIGGLAFQFAFINLLLALINLNPLLRLDGYYLLMDWLEMPMLRSRALSFIRRDLWVKLSRRESFHRDDTIYAIYGLLAFFWTALTVVTSLLALGTKLLDLPSTV